jgi:hypothetical protein
MLEDNTSILDLFKLHKKRGSAAKSVAEPARHPSEKYMELQAFFESNRGKLIQITRASKKPPAYEYVAIGTVRDVANDHVTLSGRERTDVSGDVELSELRMRLDINDRTFQVDYSKVGAAKVLDPSQTYLSGKVPRTPQNKPSCDVITIVNFNLYEIITQARSSRNNIVCLIPPGADIDPIGLRISFDHIDLLFEFADDPKLAMLDFGTIIYIRREFLNSVTPTLVSKSFSDLIHDLHKKAKRLGLKQWPNPSAAADRYVVS